jgi:hypothetical protein
MTSQLEAAKIKETDRFIIDHAILFVDQDPIANTTPETVLVLFKVLTHWTPDKNPSIATNIVNSLVLVSETAAAVDDMRAMIFWTKVTCQLGALLKREVCPNSMNTGINKASTECRYRPVTDKRKREQSEPLRFVTRDEPRDKLSVKSWDDFAIEICRVICKMYLALLESLFNKLDPVILDAIFDNNDENMRAISNEGGATMKHLLFIVDRYSNTITDAGIDTRVTRHILTSVANYIDAIVFNKMLIGVKTNALRIKMSINMLEALLEKRGGFQHGDLFKHTKQSTDVLAIGKDAFQNDSEMQKLVCPDLGSGQLNHLLRINDGEDARSLMLSPLMTASDSKGPIFAFEKETVDKKGRIGDKFLSRQGLEFLKK